MMKSILFSPQGNIFYTNVYPPISLFIFPHIKWTMGSHSKPTSSIPAFVDHLRGGSCLVLTISHTFVYCWNTTWQKLVHIKEVEVPYLDWVIIILLNFLFPCLFLLLNYINHDAVSQRNSRLITSGQEVVRVKQMPSLLKYFCCF